eukprot:572611_1
MSSILQPEELLVFGYIRHIAGINPLYPNSIVRLICYSFYFQPMGTFLIVFESSKPEQDSFIKTCDISNQWTYLQSSTRKNNINMKGAFMKCHESSFCIIPSISKDLIPALDPSASKRHQLDDVVTNAIYRVGGSNQNIGCILQPFSMVFEVPLLNTRRYGNRTVYSKSHGLISVGGCSMIHIWQSSVEQLMFDDTNKKWYWDSNTIGSMNSERFCPSAVVLDNVKQNEKLFVVGGRMDHMNDLNTCEMYCFQSGKWNDVAPMKYVRNSAGICEWREKNGDVVVVGGYNGEASKSVEHYDVHKNKWYELPKTNGEHKNCCCVTVYYDSNPYFECSNGVLVVFGNDGTAAGPSREIEWGLIEYFDHRDWRQRWNVVTYVKDCVSASLDNDFLWALPTM